MFAAFSICKQIVNTAFSSFPDIAKYTALQYTFIVAREKATKQERQVLKMKKVKFMVEHKDEYIGNLPYEIVENEIDYDIYQVETDDLTQIVVVSSNNEYIPYSLMECADGLYVNVWQVKERKF